MKRLSVALVAGVVALVAGCGDAGPNEFTDAYEKTLDSLQDVDSIGGSGPEKADRLAGLLDTAAARLDKLDPPDKAQDELDAMVKSVQAAADALRDATTASVSGNKDATTEAQAAFDKRMRGIEDAEQNLQTALAN
jgi:predicted small lipoprotein YifL